MNSLEHERLDVYITNTESGSHASRITADTPGGLLLGIISMLVKMAEATESRIG